MLSQMLDPPTAQRKGVHPVAAVVAVMKDPNLVIFMYPPHFVIALGHYHTPNGATGQAVARVVGKAFCGKSMVVPLGQHPLGVVVAIGHRQCLSVFDLGDGTGGMVLAGFGYPVAQGNLGGLPPGVGL